MATTSGDRETERLESLPALRSRAVLGAVGAGAESTFLGGCVCLLEGNCPSTSQSRQQTDGPGSGGAKLTVEVTLAPAEPEQNDGIG
ncbi:MAG: hypothetical protein CL424_20130 [Acidimicrobiaceae bacterium]|nr:hypothetical protein [Acidimicrobiaceae bacterium]